MDMHDLTRHLKESNGSKIVLLVADGLGGMPLTPDGLTELETAKTPNLDRLAKEGTCGGSIPVKPGITPGSGPGHLGLFGYDPLKYVIGRGALEATGIGFKLTSKDVAIRANFCTLDAEGKITDRRAGRISTEEAAPLVQRLKQIRIPGVEVFVEPVKEYRFVIVFRGDNLGDKIDDTDPQATGVPPLDPAANDEHSERTAEVAIEFIKQARTLLANEKKANGLTMRGFSAAPNLPPFSDVYGLHAAACAVYPMYKGLAQLVGMTLVGKAQTLAEQMAVVKENWNAYDFFFVHFKYTDSTGEDGNFNNKVAKIEELDAAIPSLLALKPDVLIVTGDHSTPSALKSHSWHPVPTLMWAKTARPDRCTTFGEREATSGGFGIFEAKYLMPLALAHAGRLMKYGA